MKTFKTILFAKLLIIIISLTTSCVYNEVYIEPDGKAYLSIFLGDRTPSLIDTDGALPRNFYWEEYYQVVPDFYDIYYEYQYHDGLGTITEAFEVNIEIWINTRNESRRNSSNSIDNYFNLDIYPDGFFEYYLKSSEIPQYKEGDIIKIVENLDGNICFRAIIKKVNTRE
jgi:hypothetical protein